jgi:hypothetical protein
MSQPWSFTPHSPLTTDHPVSAPLEVDTLDTIRIDAKMLWQIPSTSSHLTVLAFCHSSTSPMRRTRKVILIHLRIGSDIVISTMASEMIEEEVPGNFLSAATAF